MGIYIKDIEMPKDCLECVFYRRTNPIYDYCSISSAIPKGYIPNDCPLVPIPKHGRLIDADALETQDGWLSMNRSRNVNQTHIQFVYVNDIVLAPTIIEAEDDEQ